MLELSGKTEGSAGGKYRNILRELRCVKRAAGKAGCISYRRLSSSCYFCSFSIVYFLVLLLYHLLFSDAAIIQTIQPRRRMSMNMDHWGKLENTKSVFFVAFFTRNPTLNAQASNFGLCGETPLTNRSCDTSLLHCLERSCVFSKMTNISKPRNHQRYCLLLNPAYCPRSVLMCFM